MIRRSIPVLAVLVLQMLPGAARCAGGEGADAHAHHHPAQAAVGAPVSAAELPPLRILMPANGDVVGTQLAVVFETPGEIARLTMGSGPVAGIHLHIDTDGVSMMPTAQQLIRMGGARYLFLFDLPVKPGPRSLRVYWSDAMHRTIEDSVQELRLQVQADPP